MLGKNLKNKYALTDKGLSNARKGAFWTVIVNLIAMFGAAVVALTAKKRENN